MAILRLVRHRGVRAALVIGCILIVGCLADRPRLPTARELAAETGADEESLRAGRTTYLQSCTECHRLYWPREYPAAAWRRILPEMGDRSGLSRAEIRVVRCQVRFFELGKSVPEQKLRSTVSGSFFRTR